MSHFYPDDNSYRPGASSRPYPPRDDRDGNMYDDRDHSRSYSPTGRRSPHGSNRDATTPGTGTDPDPVIEVEIEMITAGALPGLLRLDEGDRCIEIATGKGIARLNTTAEAGVVAVAETAVIDQVDMHMGKRVEK
ncbi:hypothetical protein PHISCL_09488 [Aspergillus sclerotialis]|uniref:Uncharacterized protein n=1 Tax=Aspergillus sclerotialis TaxID=2070753 RepID=A0A3A2Z7K7_9EURO|nr:hypothetical protein PHISCL_09488 [Aspergillus sclerotialis]